VEIVIGGAKKPRKITRTTTRWGTEHSTEELKNNQDELREEKDVLIHQQCLQHAPRGRDGDTYTSTSKYPRIIQAAGNNYPPPREIFFKINKWLNSIEQEKGV